jgi:hypothetical protein
LDERLGVRFAAMSQFTNGAGARPGAASAAAHRAISGIGSPESWRYVPVELDDEVVVGPVQVDLVADDLHARGLGWCGRVL